MKRDKKWMILSIVFLFVLSAGCSETGGYGRTVYISEEEVMSYFKEETELSTENWEMYFEITEGELEEEKLENRVCWSKPYYLKLKEGVYLVDEKVTVTLTGKRLFNQIYEYSETGETVQTENKEEEFRYELVFLDTPLREFLCDAYFTSDQTVYYNPDDATPESVTAEELKTYSCTTVKTYEIIFAECEEVSPCKVRRVEIPESVWNYEEEGVRYLCVGTKKNCFRIYELTFQDDYRRFLDWVKEQ